MATPDNSSPGGYLTLPVRVSGPGEEWNGVQCGREDPPTPELSPLQALQRNTGQSLYIL